MSAECDRLHQHFSSLENVNFEALGSSELCSCYTLGQSFMHREDTLSSCFTEDYFEPAVEDDAAFQRYHETSEGENKMNSQCEYLSETVSCDQLCTSSEQSWLIPRGLGVLESASMTFRLGRLRLACESLLSLPIYQELEPPNLPRYSSSRRANISQGRKRMSRTRFLKYSLPGLVNISKSYDFSTLGVKNSSLEANEMIRYPYGHNFNDRGTGHYRGEISDVEMKRLSSRSLVLEDGRVLSLSTDLLEVGRSEKLDSEEITEGHVTESFNVESEQGWSCSNLSDLRADTVKKSCRNFVGSDLAGDSRSGLSEYSQIIKTHTLCEENEQEFTTRTERSSQGTTAIKVGECFNLQSVTASDNAKHMSASGKQIFVTFCDISHRSAEVVLPDGNRLETAAEDSGVAGRALVMESQLPTSSSIQETLNDQVNGMMFLPVFPKPCFIDLAVIECDFLLLQSQLLC